MHKNTGGNPAWHSEIRQVEWGSELRWNCSPGRQGERHNLPRKVCKSFSSFPQNQAEMTPSWIVDI